MSAARDIKFTMEFVEEANRRRLALETIEQTHIFATALVCYLANVIVWSGAGAAGQGLAAGIGLLCLVMLVLGRSIRPLIQELYRQFHYREKFALFLVHLTVFMLPWILTFQFYLPIMAAALLVFLCIQSINRVFFGRIYGLTMLMVLIGCMRVENFPAGSAVMLYFIALLTAFRFGHVRWRVEKFGSGLGIELRDLIHRSLPVIMIPPLLGWFVYMFAANYMIPRQLVLREGPISRDGTEGFISMSTLVFDAFYICLAIVVAAAFLNWLDKKFRKRSSAIPIDIEPMEAGEHRRAVTPEDIGDLEVEESAGPRERILGAFRSFADRLTLFGEGRHESETAEAWFARLAAAEPVNAAPFDRACYSEEDISEEEADGFVGSLDEWLNRLKEKAAQEESAKNAPPPEGPNESDNQ